MNWLWIDWNVAIFNLGVSRSLGCRTSVNARSHSWQSTSEQNITSIDLQDRTVVILGMEIVLTIAFKVFNNFLKYEGSKTFKSCLSGQTLSPGNKDLDKQGDQELRASEFLQTWENLPQRQASLQQSINLAFIVLWHKLLKKRKKACMLHSVWSQMAKKVLWSEEKGTELCGLNASAMFGKHGGGSMMSWSFLCHSVVCTGKLWGNNEQSQIQSSKWTFSKAHVTSNSTVT